jgi:cell division septum initiation protein DivIVA
MINTRLKRDQEIKELENEISYLCISHESLRLSVEQALENSKKLLKKAVELLKSSETPRLN